MAVNVPKRPAPSGGRRMTERRIKLIAFACAFVSFIVMAVFLFADYEKVEERDAALQAQAEPQARTQAPTQPQMNADAQVRQREERQPPPTPVEGTPSQTLNDALKAASNGDWGRLDGLLAGASASVGSGRKGATSELSAQGRKAIAAGDYGKAIQTLNGALAANPEDADALNNLAFALLRQGRIEDAYAQVTRSLELAPAHAATWANAAEILAERDNSVASQAALRVAIHLAADRQRTRRFLEQADETVSSAKFRAVIADVLPQFDAIPKTGRSAS